MHKAEISHVLKLMAALLALKGETAFKVRAYEKAARSIELSDFDLESLSREKGLTKIPGVGRNLEPKIYEMLHTGKSSYLETLAEQVPLGLAEVMKVPGVGPKTARLLHEGLGVTDLKSLKDTAEKGGLRAVPGLGAKREAIIERGVNEILKYSGRAILGLALPVAEHILTQVSKVGLSGSVVGEIRRSMETVSCAEILLKADSNELVISRMTKGNTNHFLSKDVWEKAWSSDDESFLFSTNLGIPLKIYTAPAESFGWRQIMTTGPLKFTNWLTELAESQGCVVSEKVPKKKGELLDADSESAVFHALGLCPVPAELRHNEKYVRMAEQNLKIQPVGLTHIQGDLHLHTTWSDGLFSIEDMVKKSLALGYSYIAITDHATKIKVIGGLDPLGIEAQRKEIENISKKYPQIRILTGIEVDILKDGNLALPDPILAKLDIVIASIHHDLDGSGQRIVDRLIRATNNPHVDIIGHPSGRLIGRRPGNSQGFRDLFRAAQKEGTLLEINASPHRLDLSDELASQAKSFGVRFAIGSDAHGTGAMEDMLFGVAASARRAGLEPQSIINAQPLDAWFPPKG